MTIIAFHDYWDDEPHPAVEVLSTPHGVRLAIERWSPPRGARSESRQWVTTPPVVVTSLLPYLRARFEAPQKAVAAVDVRIHYDEQPFDESLDYCLSPEGSLDDCLSPQEQRAKLRVTKTVGSLVRVDLHTHRLYDAVERWERLDETGAPPVATWMKKRSFIRFASVLESLFQGGNP